MPSCLSTIRSAQNFVLSVDYLDSFRLQVSDQHQAEQARRGQPALPGTTCTVQANGKHRQHWSQGDETRSEGVQSAKFEWGRRQWSGLRHRRRTKRQPQAAGEEARGSAQDGLKGKESKSKTKTTIWPSTFHQPSTSENTFQTRVCWTSSS